MTPEEAEAYQQRAIRGLENLGLEAEADDVADMTPEQYAEKKGIEITERNPRRRAREVMASKRELEERVTELQEENEELQSRLDEILDIVAPPEEEDEEEEEELGEE